MKMRFIINTIINKRATTIWLPLKIYTSGSKVLQSVSSVVDACFPL
jgi:hypothetical protein